MTKAILELTNEFADGTTRKLEIGPLNPSSLNKETVRAAVKNFNPADVAGIYVSEGGSSCTKIASAVITVTNETEINLN